MHTMFSVPNTTLHVSQRKIAFLCPPNTDTSPIYNAVLRTWEAFHPNSRWKVIAPFTPFAQLIKDCKPDTSPLFGSSAASLKIGDMARAPEAVIAKVWEEVETAYPGCLFRYIQRQANTVDISDGLGVNTAPPEFIAVSEVHDKSLAEELKAHGYYLILLNSTLEHRQKVWAAAGKNWDGHVRSGLPPGEIENKTEHECVEWMRKLADMEISTDDGLEDSTMKIQIGFKKWLSAKSL